MLEAIVKGLSAGLLLSVFIGPVTMYLIEVSIKRGIREALFVDIGIFFSDLFMILLSYFFLNQLKDIKEESVLIGFITGGVFLLFGVLYLVKSGKSVKPAKEVLDEVKDVQGKHLAVNVLKGFFLNIMNPAVLLYWLSVMVVAVDMFMGDDVEHGERNIFIFFTTLLMAFFSIDVLKIFGAAYLRRFLKKKVIERINIFTGFVFILAGVFFLVRSLVTM